jgi:hypothetical protein
VTARLVGRVAQLWRYPVKSMRGEPVEAADVSWYGLAGDRRWAFVRPDSERESFPWLTLRERPEMATYRPRLVDPQHPNRSRVVVRTPDGRELDVTDPGLAAQLCTGSRAMRLARGTADCMPLSLLSTRSVDAASDLAAVVSDARRFRPNILVTSESHRDQPELDWVGAELRVGGLRLRVDRPDRRCPVVAVDPDTGDREPALLATVARHFDNQLGVYASTVVPGTVQVGDPVCLTDGR